MYCKRLYMGVGGGSLGEKKGGKLKLSVSLMLAHPSPEILGVFEHCEAALI